MKRSILLFFIMALAAFPLSARVYFVVSPPRFELNMAPGQSLTETVNIINGDSTAPLRLKVAIKGWQKNKAGQISYLEASEQTRSCGQWITVNPSEFEIPATGTETARFTVAVPETVSGSYWAVIFFESQPDTTVKSMVGMRVTGRLGTTVYVNIDGTLQYQAEMTGFFYKRAGYQKHDFTVTVKNSGNAHFRPKGTLKINDAAGKNISTSTIPEDIVILPGTLRDIKLVIKETIPIGRYTANMTLDCGLKELLEGEIQFEVTP